MTESTRIFGDEVEIFLIYKQQLVNVPADGRRNALTTKIKIQKHKGLKEGTELHGGFSFVISLCLLGVLCAPGFRTLYEGIYILFTNNG